MEMNGACTACICSARGGLKPVAVGLISASYQRGVYFRRQFNEAQPRYAPGAKDSSLM